MKSKGQSTNCDGEFDRRKLATGTSAINVIRFVTVCGVAINLASYKEHAVECKMKLAKVKHRHPAIWLPSVKPYN